MWKPGQVAEITDCPANSGRMVAFMSSMKKCFRLQRVDRESDGKRKKRRISSEIIIDITALLASLSSFRIVPRRVRLRGGLLVTPLSTASIWSRPTKNTTRHVNKSHAATLSAESAADGCKTFHPWTPPLGHCYSEVLLDVRLNVTLIWFRKCRAVVLLCAILSQDIRSWNVTIFSC